MAKHWKAALEQAFPTLLHGQVDYEAEYVLAAVNHAQACIIGGAAVSICGLGMVVSQVGAFQCSGGGTALLAKAISLARELGATFFSPRAPRQQRPCILGSGGLSPTGLEPCGGRGCHARTDHCAGS
ncbi:unnamed protein product [Symbiodinium natans]|uniref:Uncharacterized protein n=1 Tax=Symbiodinium natans TaxID=878477 RepID=A0A812PY83_9DINO|nr:unnamed protein product [Symbiodinium natans]